MVHRCRSQGEDNGRLAGRKKFIQRRAPARVIAMMVVKDEAGLNRVRRPVELRRGPETLFRKLVLPHLRDTFDDLLAGAADADLMIAGEMVYARAFENRASTSCAENLSLANGSQSGLSP